MLYYNQEKKRRAQGMKELTNKEIELIATLARNDNQMDMFLLSKEEKRMAEGLVKKNYIQKGTAEYDGRYKVYSLTHKGMNAY
jgi:DNA-binding MarR family transcriptional regulator